jgi:hypothetical protein
VLYIIFLEVGTERVSTYLCLGLNVDLVTGYAEDSDGFPLPPAVNDAGASSNVRYRLFPNAFILNSHYRKISVLV